MTAMALLMKGLCRIAIQGLLEQRMLEYAMEEAKHAQLEHGELALGRLHLLVKFAEMD
jgi:hypothetical protein